MGETVQSNSANVDSHHGLGASDTPRRIDLSTLIDVRREMSRVYRRMRTGKLKSQDGTRFAYVLSMIGKLIESSDLQDRLEALERAVAQTRN